MPLVSGRPGLSDDESNLVRRVSFLLIEQRALMKRSRRIGHVIADDSASQRG